MSPLSTQLTWTHFIELPSVNKEEARLYYAKLIAENQWSIRETQNQIEKKEFELEKTVQKCKNDFQEFKN